MKMEVGLQHTLIADRYLWGPVAPPPGTQGSIWKICDCSTAGVGKGLRRLPFSQVEASDAVHHPVVQRVACSCRGEKSCLAGPE